MKNSPAEKPANKRNNRFNLPLVFGALGLIVLSFIAINWETFSPGKSKPICSRLCHFTQPETESWKKSSHAGVSCYECHIEDFYIGFSLSKMKTTGSRIWITLNDSFNKPLNSDSHYGLEKSPNVRCTKCHSVKTRTITPKPGLKMSESAMIKHVKAGMTCAMCHNRTAHKGTEKFDPIPDWKKRFDKRSFNYQDFMDMKQGCWRCHSSSKTFIDKAALSSIKNGKKASSACTTCHTEIFLKESIGRCEKECHSSKFLRKTIDNNMKNGGPQ